MDDINAGKAKAAALARVAPVSLAQITAFLSLILGFMNLLPIPALDGGHVMFLLYEMISGRKPSDKAMEFGQLIGLIFVGGLLLLANGNDLWRWATGQY